MQQPPWNEPGGLGEWPWDIYAEGPDGWPWDTYPGEPGAPDWKQQPGRPGGFPGQFPGGFPGGQQPGRGQGPTSPPPTQPPQRAAVGVFRVDPGAIRGCRFRWTYVWLTNGDQFWFWPSFVGRYSIAGWRWNPRRRRAFYYGVDLRSIEQFRC